MVVLLLNDTFVIRTWNGPWRSLSAKNFKDRTQTIGFIEELGVLKLPIDNDLGAFANVAKHFRHRHGTVLRRR